MYLQTVAIQEHLLHQVALQVSVLDLLRGDVLALTQLEDVLLPVHDLHVAVYRDDADVAAVQPALGVNSLRGLGRVLVVSEGSPAAGK